MTRATFIPGLLVALAVGVVFVHCYAARRRLPHAIAALGYLVPAFGCGVLVWAFVWNPGHTLAQAAVGDERAYALWSTWVDMWPTLVTTQAAACVGHLLWLLCSLPRMKRRWLPVPALGTALSGLALFVVFAYAPTA